MKKIAYLLSFCILASSLSGQVGTIVGAGFLSIHGDVKTNDTELNSIQIGVRKMYTSKFSHNFILGYAKTSGQDQRLFSKGAFRGGLVEDVYSSIPAFWGPNYALDYMYIDYFLNWDIPLYPNKLVLSFGLGAGISYSTLHINLRDSENQIYNITPSTLNSVNSYKDLYDDTYETEFEDRSDWNIHLVPKVALSYNVAPSIWIEVSGRAQLTSSDYMDSIQWRTSNEKTNDKDRIGILSFSVIQYF